MPLRAPDTLLLTASGMLREPALGEDFGRIGCVPPAVLRISQDRMSCAGQVCVRCSAARLEARPEADPLSGSVFSTFFACFRRHFARKGFPPVQHYIWGGHKSSGKFNKSVENYFYAFNPGNILVMNVRGIEGLNKPTERSVH